MMLEFAFEPWAFYSHENFNSWDQSLLTFFHVIIYPFHFDSFAILMEVLLLVFG